jgi:hypothetical protein
MQTKLNFFFIANLSKVSAIWFEGQKIKFFCDVKETKNTNILPHISQGGR